MLEIILALELSIIIFIVLYIENMINKKEDA